MTKYARAAVEAVKLCTELRMSPEEAWEAATCGVFTKGSAAQKKGCPKSAFLGLCEAGLVRGVPAGSYTRSAANKAYAITAAKALVEDSTLAFSPQQLWERVLADTKKQHNGQMDVVLALWSKKQLTVG